jgi:hypothetical protein
MALAFVPSSAPFQIDVDVGHIDAIVKGLNELRRNSGDRVYGRAVNRVGDMTFTRVIRLLADETGATQKRVREQVRKFSAVGTTVPFKIVARGGYLSLDAFQPRQTLAGISAAPWGKRRVFKGSFFGPAHRVYVRKGKSRLPIRVLYGPAVPNQMLKGKTQEIAAQMFRENFADRVEHEVAFEVDRINRGANR